jgi:hypothetical protein
MQEIQLAPAVRSGRVRTLSLVAEEAKRLAVRLEVPAALQEH